MASLNEITSLAREAKQNREGVVELIAQLESNLPEVVDETVEDYFNTVEKLSQSGQKILESSNPSQAKLKKEIQVEMAFYNALNELYNNKLGQGKITWESFRQEVRMLNGSCNNGTILQEPQSKPAGGQPAAQNPRSSGFARGTPTPQPPITTQDQVQDDEMAEIMRAIAEADAAEEKLRQQAALDSDAARLRRETRNLASRDHEATRATGDLRSQIQIDARLRSEYEEADRRRAEEEGERALNQMRGLAQRGYADEQKARDLLALDSRAERDAELLRDKLRIEADADRAVREMRGVANVGSKFQQEQDRIEKDRKDREKRKREEEEGERALQALRGKADQEAKERRDRERRFQEDAAAEKEAERLREIMREESKRNKLADDAAKKMRDFSALDPKKQREMEKYTRNERESDGLANIMREIAAAQKKGADIASKQNLGYEYSDEDDPRSKRYNSKAAASVIGNSLGSMLNQGAFADLLSKGIVGGLLDKENQETYSNQEKEKLEKELKTVASQLDSLKTLVGDEEQRYLQLKDKLHSMRTLGNEIETEIENLRQEKEEEEQASHLLETEIAGLEKDLQELESERAAIEKQDEQRLNVHQEVRKERTKHKDLLQKLEMEVEEYKSSYESLMRKWQEEINGAPAVASTPLLGNYLNGSGRSRATALGEPQHHFSTLPQRSVYQPQLSSAERLTTIRSRIAEPYPSTQSQLPATYGLATQGVYSTQRFGPFASAVQDLPAVGTESFGRAAVSIRSSSREPGIMSYSTVGGLGRSSSAAPQQSFQTGSYAERYLSTLRK